MGRGFIYGHKLQKGIKKTLSKSIIFHDENLIVLMVIARLVGGRLVALIGKVPFMSYDFIDHKWLEVGWTFIPIIILVTLALPSLELLYGLDTPSSIKPKISLKAIGRQWYWSYEIKNLPSQGCSLSFDSYMLQTCEQQLRLLEVDKPVVIPYGKYIRLLVSGGDVIHRFCVPSLGIKMDAVPGRLNQSFFLPLKVGSYFGQCSEICGANHRFMPINMEICASFLINI